MPHESDPGTCVGPQVLYFHAKLLSLNAKMNYEGNESE